MVHFTCFIFGLLYNKDNHAKNITFEATCVTVLKQITRIRQQKSETKLLQIYDILCTFVPQPNLDNIARKKQ
jgi:hypothetical protein